jgi:hypothetical protein
MQKECLNTFVAYNFEIYQYGTLNKPTEISTENLLINVLCTRLRFSYKLQSTGTAFNFLKYIFNLNLIPMFVSVLFRGQPFTNKH